MSGLFNIFVNSLRVAYLDFLYGIEIQNLQLIEIQECLLQKKTNCASHDKPVFWSCILLFVLLLIMLITMKTIYRFIRNSYILLMKQEIEEKVVKKD